MSRISIGTSFKAAIDAARVEGRAEAAGELETMVRNCLNKFAELVGPELDDVGRTRFAQFSAALQQNIAHKVEEARREQWRALEGFVESYRELEQSTREHLS